MATLDLDDNLTALEAIPPEAEIRQQLAIASNRVALLRQMLKLAREKARTIDRLRDWRTSGTE